MRTVYTAFEIFLALLLVALGIFTFESGFFGSPRDSIVVLPIGAVFLVSGAVVLAYAIRSRIWHHRMLRERPLETTGPLPEMSHRG